MRYFCCDPRRREAVLSTGPGNPPNGIDFLEVVDSDAAVEADRQRILRVHFLKAPLPPLDALTERDVHIEGGVRVTGIEVESVAWSGQVLEVRVDRPGDFSLYRLRIGEPDSPPAGLDFLLAEVEFAFKVECPTDFDCRDDCACPPGLLDDPEIDYEARDYASFRQLMLDRMAVLAPDWRERNAADLGIALVEVLAYAADHLSYELDAIGMEATLATARRRASARRHARLVDYAMHDGSNARGWVQIKVDGDNVELPEKTQLLTRIPGLAAAIAPFSDAERRAFQANPVVFETMHAATLWEDLNELRLYSWGDRECCLPAGATSLTLRGNHPQLVAGMVLVFVEKKGPRTGSEADADPEHRHAVRLTAVEPTTDPLGTWFDDPDAPPAPLDVTEIAWADEDALPFPLCISAVVDGALQEDVSVALGNIILTDHGRTLQQPLPETPQPDPRLALAVAGACSHCDPVEPVPTPPRYTPLLDETPPTMSATLGRALPGEDPRRWAHFDPGAPAASVFNWDPRHILPAMYLIEEGGAREWYPRRDLLASGRFAAEFVVDLDPDGRARLRFGDDEYGLRPASGTSFEAVYRVGSGLAGNVGVGALHHVLSADPRIAAVSNPIPARGGSAPESIEHVRQMAPSAFRIQQRAVTPEDYAEVAGRHPQVQRAVATERWTGSWYTIFLIVDRRAGLPVDEDFERELRNHLERFRMAGHDIEIDGPRFVPVELELRVCVLSDFYRSDVKRELLSRLSARVDSIGQRGFFHPDNFSFGDAVYLSRIYAIAQATPGVRYVEALAFQRLDAPDTSALDSGALQTGRIEIPRLDNDSNFPERGVLRLTMEGGR